MTGKVFNGNPATLLVLILPFAGAVILLYEAWPFLLGLVALIVIWKLFDNYLWQQWCFQVDPMFNQLLQANQGCLTPMDLSLKANLGARRAKRFLDKKAEEYGAYRKDLPEGGQVYYFITASTLGSILDDSEPVANETDFTDEIDDDRDTVEATIPPEVIVTTPEPEKPPQSLLSSPFAQLAEIKEERQKSSQTSSETVSSETVSPDEIKEVQTEIETVSQPEVLDTSIESVSSDEFLTATDRVLDSSLTEEESPEEEEYLETETSTDKPRKLSLIQVDLAKRLDTTPSTIGRRKTEPDFAQWSQSKDPDGIAWKYLRKSRVFVPVDPDIS
ncbi:hypothetical protein [Aphanothece sacrum]|uniref:Uncharacterized protein n=1 Tax=Aphanothece sacrum FPU1 TaxID=1920663 RepID=A0A401IGB3_APHSA|nr:hypothetical protein [Aphanothece sacrum]GBF80249.1 hypothetical protein AsFPU1_1650 [Aphanothece sacrum FPU1]GBF83654.1 hypothetical protein AsFPU3_0697 [Aphanothece sacrum FPU3]